MKKEIQTIESLTYRETGEAERLSMVLSFTVPSVETYQVIGKSGRFLAEPIEREDWTQYLARAAKVSEDTQNLIGVQTGFYPKGLIIEGKYTYKAHRGQGEYKERKFKPTYLLHPEKSTNELFPGSSWLTDITEKMGAALDNTNHKNLPKDLGSSDTLGDVVFRFFSDQKESEGRVYTKLHHGYPILYCEEKEDLEVFRPHEKVALPEDVRGISFVTSDLRRSRPQGRIVDTPIVACLSDCPDSIAQRLFVSQLVWRRANGNESPSPVYVSRGYEHLTKQREITDERYDQLMNLELEQKAKDKALALLISEEGPISRSWTETNRIQRVMTTVSNELWIPNADVFMGNWLSEAQIVDPRRKKINEIEEKFEYRLKNVLDTLSEWPFAFPSRENQLLVANYMSHFALRDWPMARQNFITWPDRLKFLKSLGIPRSSRV